MRTFVNRNSRLIIILLVTLVLASGLGALTTTAEAEPSNDGWHPISPVRAPAARSRHSAVWTGTEMIIWGGRDSTKPLGDGASFSPASDAWMNLSDAGAPSPRAGHTAVWTGREMLVWGGIGNGLPGYRGDGAAYNPASHSWRALPVSGAPGPREGQTAVWTGQSMIIWGGHGTRIPGAAGTALDDGASYDPQADEWTPVAGIAAPSPRYGHTAVWTGQEMIVWGGTDGTSVLGDGGAYNPTTKTWRALAARGAPRARAFQTAVWTGSTTLVWGGLGAGSLPLADGAAYDPVSNAWIPLSAAGAPSPRLNHTAVWTGRDMLIWGGVSETSSVLGDGGQYAPATDTWRPLVSSGAPSPRALHSAIWTGSQMIIWGGANAAGPLGDGASYTPPGPAVSHDSRYFPQTGFRIDNDVIWDYFTHRGGISTFGYPVSRTFLFQGFPVQFFQRRIVQIAPDGHARLLNVLDPGLLPYTSFNFATVPAFDASLVATAPNPTDAPAILAWVQAHAPDRFNGMPVNFYQTFQNTVPFSVAFPNGGNSSLLAGIDLEVWGVPTSQPMVDPHNHNFVYLRFQRGITMYDASCNCTQGILLADDLKSIITGQNLPADLAQEAKDSPFYRQYDPGAPNWVHDPRLLPDTDLTNAFRPE
jgi:N-acetylneuraminic acid mutarotase